MHSLKIRSFRSDDAVTVADIWRHCLPSSHPWNEPLSVICSKLNQADNLFLVGEYDGDVVATVMAGFDGVRGWIYSLAVVESLRGQGFGKQMLVAAEKALEDRGCRKIGLQVRDTNCAVIGFYEKCGFNREDRASMAKVLSPPPVIDAVPELTIDGTISISQTLPCDKSALLEHLNDTSAFRDQMLTMPFPYLEIDADQWIFRTSKESLQVNRARTWSIRDEGKLIGGVGLLNLPFSMQQGEIGYWIARPYWGRGIVPKVVDRVCRYVFNELDVFRVWAKVLSNNRASTRVMDKAGFQHEGTLRKHFRRDDQVFDVKIYGRLRSD